MKPTSWTRYLNIRALPLAALLLAGCGGGGGGGVSVADGGIRGTGASVGPVSGFGSVFVNGIRFETDGNVISNDGISTESELDKGMILRIEGQWRNNGEGTAERVEYDDTFRGEVVVDDELSAVDPETGLREQVVFTIYGQTVVADKQTVFKGVSLQSLTNEDFVRVSGWRLPNGDYRASYVGLVSPNTADVEIEGSIDSGSFNAGLNRFRINGFLIEYDPNNVDFRDGLRVSDLQSQDFRVEVEGELRDIDGETGIFAASLERDETRRYQRGDEDDIEFSGPVLTAFDSADRTFTINGLTVLVPDDDVFDDGLTADDLHPGLLVQVEGEFLADGRVEAEEIEIRDADAEVEGPINANAIDFDARTFRLGGVLVQVTPQTIITDDEDDDRRIGLNDLNGSFELEVEGIERSDQNGDVFLEATKIEREEDEGENEYELTGRLGDVDEDSITVLGVRLQVILSGDGETDFGDTSLATLEGQFPQEQPLLEVEYVERPVGSNNFVAEEVELEEDEDDD